MVVQAWGMVICIMHFIVHSTDLVHVLVQQLGMTSAAILDKLSVIQCKVIVHPQCTE